MLAVYLTARLEAFVVLELRALHRQLSNAQPCKVSDDQATGSMEQCVEAATLRDLAHRHRAAAADGLQLATPPL